MGRGEASGRGFRALEAHAPAALAAPVPALRATSGRHRSHCSRETAGMRVAVIGTGLIGASVGLAARRAGHDVRGWDADGATLAAAVARGAVEAAEDADAAAAGAELVVVAVPVTSAAAAVGAALAAAPAASVTD